MFRDLLNDIRLEMPGLSNQLSIIMKLYRYNELLVRVI